VCGGDGDVSEQAERILRTAADIFGWDRLRPGQLEAMEAVLAGQDVLAVMPTGAGKSAIYQVPALLVDGATLVVSPLIALQRDQVAGLADSAAPGAVAVNSAQPQQDSERAWDAVEAGTAEYLFLSPEQLAKDEVVADLAQARPSLLVVDEAHCVSAWGYGFRPDYLRLGHVIAQLGHPTVIALTATAAPPVRADIVERLGLRDVREIVAGFDRPNLFLEVLRFLDDASKRRAVIERTAAEPKPGLLYAATRKDAEAYAAELAALGLAAVPYHAGMKAAERKRVHQRFLDDEVDVVVATTAFGMGIDKPNVRFVFHASVTSALDSYYQEVGRAGRDGEPANVTLFYRPEDLGLQKFLSASRPPEEAIAAVAAALRAHAGPMRVKELREQVDVTPAKRTRAVNLLEQAGVVTTTGDGRLEYADSKTTVAAAVRRAVEIDHGHERLNRSRIEMMRGYAETTGCRRQYLLGYFGEQLTKPCGACDTCRAGTATDQPSNRSGFQPNSQVHHSQWGPGVVLRTEDDRVTVLFEQNGYRTLSLPALEDNGLLSPVGERSGE
jgi:ATP-dependent DNA helicase RecQ